MDEIILMNEEDYKKFLDIKINLMNAFLLHMTQNVLDISYNTKEENILELQFVLLENTNFPSIFEETMKKYLYNYQVSENILYVSKEKFNENQGGWLPSGYEWLRYVLYSKAEIL